MILGFIALFILLLTVTNIIIAKTDKNKSKCIPILRIIAIETIALIALIVLVSSLVIPANECTYSFYSQTEVAPIDYSESVSAANFFFDGNEYKYMLKDDEGASHFYSVKASLVHINHTEGVAHIETYIPIGFKHASTWIYGIPLVCEYHYEIYAPEGTIREATQPISPE